MNRGVLQSSPVQQMMAGNPNFWNINGMRPPTPQSSPLLPPPANNLFPPYPFCYENQEFHESWSQLLLGRMVDEEDKSGMVGHFQNSISASVVNVKQENPAVSNNNFYGHANEEDHFQQAATKPTWSQVMPPASSSPNKSRITSFSSTNELDFTSSKVDTRHPPHDRSSECNSSAASGGAAKKARVQSSLSSQSTFKARKEKLGDRITALHQLVSPFGKTDTASVLLEAIGYIRFLQSQIELLNDDCMKMKGTSDQELSHEEPKKDLRSRGLCLVPVSCTVQVGSDNGADYWAPALGGGSFR